MSGVSSSIVGLENIFATLRNSAIGLLAVSNFTGFPSERTTVEGDTARERERERERERVERRRERERDSRQR